MEGSVSAVLNYLMIVAVFFAVMVFLYVFPVLARFYNPVKVTLKNALLMSIRHLPYTILMIAITATFVFITFFDYFSTRLWTFHLACDRICAYYFHSLLLL